MKSYKIKKFQTKKYKFPIGYRYYYVEPRFGINKIIDYITLQNVDSLSNFRQTTIDILKSYLAENENLYLVVNKKEQIQYDMEYDIKRAIEYK